MPRAICVAILLVACGQGARSTGDGGPPIKVVPTDADTATDTHTGLVAVSLVVTRLGAGCRALEVLQLPAEYWWDYRDGTDNVCADMSWYAYTDEGDCWDISQLCGGAFAQDPFIQQTPEEVAALPTVANCDVPYCP